MKEQYWKIEYLPSFNGSGVFIWIFKGTEKELDKYLNENHMCKCVSCLHYTNFFDSPSSAEYLVTEIKEEDL